MPTRSRSLATAHVAKALSLSPSDWSQIPKRDFCLEAAIISLQNRQSPSAPLTIVSRVCEYSLSVQYCEVKLAASSSSCNCKR